MGGERGGPAEVDANKKRDHDLARKFGCGREPGHVAARLQSAAGCLVKLMGSFAHEGRGRNALQLIMMGGGCADYTDRFLDGRTRRRAD